MVKIEGLILSKIQILILWNWQNSKSWQIWWLKVDQISNICHSMFYQKNYLSPFAIGKNCQKSNDNFESLIFVAQIHFWTRTYLVKSFLEVLSFKIDLNWELLFLVETFSQIFWQKSYNSYINQENIVTVAESWNEEENISWNQLCNVKLAHMGPNWLKFGLNELKWVQMGSNRLKSALIGSMGSTLHHSVEIKEFSTTQILGVISTLWHM